MYYSFCVLDKRKFFSCNASINEQPWLNGPFMPSDDVDGGDGQKKQLVNPHVELRE